MEKSAIGDANIVDLQQDTVVSLQHTLYYLVSPFMAWVAPALIASLWDDAIVFPLFPLNSPGNLRT